MPPIIQLLRIQQWGKNIFIFFPLLFAGQLFIPAQLEKACLAFVIFSLMASALYIMNDIMDKNTDANHPTKCTRPIASGSVPTYMGYSIIGILILVIIRMGTYMPDVLPMLGVYAVVMFGYNIGLKNIAILDMFIVAMGFVLRLFVGSDAVNIPYNPWIASIVFSLILFFIITKRRQEMIMVGSHLRKSLQKYSVQSLDIFMTLTATSSIILYTLYATLQNPALLITIPYAVFAIMRYIVLLDTVENKDLATTSLKDTPTQINIILYMGTLIYILA